MKALSELKDEDLLKRYAAGDQTAANVLTLRLLPKVYRHARRLLGDASEAEDVAQDAFIRLWKIAPSWRPGEAQVTTWLYRVTANLCLDRLRLYKSVSLEAAGDPQDQSPSAANRLQIESRAVALQSALQNLPDRQRQAVILRHLDELSNPQIGEIMEITPRAVESLIARGKKALADLLVGQRAELGYEDDTE